MTYCYLSKEIFNQTLLIIFKTTLLKTNRYLNVFTLTRADFGGTIKWKNNDIEYGPKTQRVEWMIPGNPEFYVVI